MRWCRNLPFPKLQQPSGSPVGASPFPISAGRGRYCIKGVGSHADTGRRLFLSGYTPDLGHYPPCHTGSAQGRYGQCAGRIQCYETNQRHWLCRVPIWMCLPPSCVRSFKSGMRSCWSRSAWLGFHKQRSDLTISLLLCQSFNSIHRFLFGVVVCCQKIIILFAYILIE